MQPPEGLDDSCRNGDMVPGIYRPEEFGPVDGGEETTFPFFPGRDDSGELGNGFHQQDIRVEGGVVGNNLDAGGCNTLFER